MMYKTELMEQKGKTQFEEIQNSDGVLFPFVTYN